jgi:predicted porin
MNKKLLSSTALVSALMISGAALAEFKVGGDITATISAGSDETTGGKGSGETIGNETNINFSGSRDLSNGLKATYAGKLELDGLTSGFDHEYELKIGAGDVYVSLASDGGQSNRTSMTPFVSYPIGSTAKAVSNSGPAFNGDSYLAGVHTSNNIGFGGKIGTGNFVVRYAPDASGSQADDATNINADRSTKVGSGMMFAYNGTFGPVGLNLGYTTETPKLDSGANDDQKEQRIGLRYDIAGAKIGADYIKFESGTPTGIATVTGVGNNSTSQDRNTIILGAAFPVSKEVTIGLYFQTTEDDTNVSNKPDEDIKMISIGYNLGGGSVALSIVDSEDLNNTAGTDSQGLMLTTKVGF